MDNPERASVSNSPNDNEGELASLGGERGRTPESQVPGSFEGIGPGGGSWCLRRELVNRCHQLNWDDGFAGGDGVGS